MAAEEDVQVAPEDGRRPVASDGVPPLVRLHNPIRTYAWGSHTALASLQGRPSPTPAPEAELWIGAHPSTPSTARLPGGQELPLTELLERAPEQILGAGLLGRHGARLPFLLKVLAAEEPLSLQAHPSAVQADAGFAAEEARGVPLDARERVFRDPWPKPELLCALTRFHALCGFRPAGASVAFLRRLGVAELAATSDRLAAHGDAALVPTVASLLRWPQATRGELVARVRTAAEGLASGDDADARTGRLLLGLACRYPDDPGVVVAALLHELLLEPGEAIHVPAGELHTYLHGTGVEVMASSDNVLRGGLTSKHVDVDGLVAVLTGRALPPPRVQAVPVTPSEQVYPVTTDAFRLSRLELQGAVELDRRGPELLLSVAGRVTVRGDALAHELGPGRAVLVPASTRRLRLEGAGLLFRATAGEAAASEPAGPGR